MKQGRWDRDKIRDALRKLHRKGIDLSYNALARRHQSLVSAANYHFGSFRHAVEMAGLDYARIRRKPKWTQPKVIGLIKRAHRAGEDLSWRAVTARGDELAHAAMAAVHPQLFGNWNAALDAAGINPRRVARYRHWTRDSIVAELKARAARKWPVNAGHMQVELPGLYGAATRLFGSYNKALAGAGIDPAGVRQRRDWSRRKVLDLMQAFEHEHCTLAHTAIRDHDPGLLRAIYKYFPGIDAARLSLHKRQPARQAKASSRALAHRGTTKLNGTAQLTLFSTVPSPRRRRARVLA